jgi:hypothetical protein
MSLDCVEGYVKCPKCGGYLEHIGDEGVCANKMGWHFLVMFECDKCKTSWNYGCSPTFFSEVELNESA